MKFESRLDTPLGPLAILANDEAIEAVTFDLDGQRRPANAISDEGLRQLAQYFEGERRQFDLPLSPSGTAFRQQAWQALQAIPYGETRFYGQQAELMGNPKAVRAVGAANGANPIAIVIPCHRVIGKDGSLTGYAGGLDKKAWLLAFEQRHGENGC